VTSDAVVHQPWRSNAGNCRREHVCVDERRRLTDKCGEWPGRRRPAARRGAPIICMPGTTGGGRGGQRSRRGYRRRIDPTIGCDAAVGRGGVARGGGPRGGYGLMTSAARGRGDGPEGRSWRPARRNARHQGLICGRLGGAGGRGGDLILYDSATTARRGEPAPQGRSRCWAADDAIFTHSGTIIGGGGGIELLMANSSAGARRGRRARRDRSSHSPAPCKQRLIRGGAGGTVRPDGYYVGGPAGPAASRCFFCLDRRKRWPIMARNRS